MRAIFSAADAMPPAPDAQSHGARAARVRLLYVRDTTIVCGPGKTIVNTWRTLDASRYALTIASTRPAAGQSNALLERARRFGAEVVPFDIGGGVDLAGARRLAALLRSGGYDILQTHDAQTRRLGALAARLAGLPPVTSVHGWIFNTRKERGARWLDLQLIRLADHVVAISDRLKREVVAAGTPENRVTVLRNAVLLDDYTLGGGGAALRRELGIPEGHAVLSIIGRLSLEKGHEVFLEAAHIIAAAHDRVTFLIVGDGPLRAQLEARVNALN